MMLMQKYVLVLIQNNNINYVLFITNEHGNILTS